MGFQRSRNVWLWLAIGIGPVLCMGGFSTSIQGIVRAKTVKKSYEFLITANAKPVQEIFKPLNEAVSQSDQHHSIFKVLNDRQELTQMALAQIRDVAALEAKVYTGSAVLWFLCLLLFVGLAFYADPMLKEAWKKWKEKG